MKTPRRLQLLGVFFMALNLFFSRRGAIEELVELLERFGKLDARATEFVSALAAVDLISSVDVYETEVDVSTDDGRVLACKFRHVGKTPKAAEASAPLLNPTKWDGAVSLPAGREGLALRPPGTCDVCQFVCECGCSGPCYDDGCLHPCRWVCSYRLDL